MGEIARLTEPGRAEPKVRRILRNLSSHLRRGAFGIFVSFVLLLGIDAGFRLSELPKLETYKLLNLAGLTYDFLGVLVLSELLASSTKWKRVCVNFLAPAILWFHTLFPSGALVGAGVIAGLMHKPSSELVFKFSLVFFGYLGIPLSIFQELVVLPKLWFVKKDIETRWRWFGLLLLLSGVGLQLVAGVLVLGR